MSSSERCSICELEKRNWPTKMEFPEEAYGKMWNIEWNYLCSLECYRVWRTSRTIHLVLSQMKQMDSWSFEKFQEVFRFDTAGGYAQEKYQKMRLSPFGFLVGLSKDNLIKMGTFWKEAL